MDQSGRILGDRMGSDVLNSLTSLNLVSGDVLYATGPDTLVRLAKGTDGQLLTLASGVPSWAAAVAGAVTSLTSSSGSIAVNLALANNFSHTFTENTTLANPTNIVVGQSGCIAFTQHASSAKTLAFGSYWIEATSGTAPAVSTTTSAQNLLSYYVFDATHVYYTLNKHGVT